MDKSVIKNIKVEGKMTTLEKVLSCIICILIIILTVVCSNLYYSHKLADERLEHMKELETLLGNKIEYTNVLISKKSEHFYEIGYDTYNRFSGNRKLYNNKEHLSKWVYNNSNVPYSIASKIVNHVLETDHPLLLLALFKSESSFNPMAVSHKNAYGLGQITAVFKDILIDNGIISEMRDLLIIDNAVKATELVWEYFLEKTNGRVRDTLSCYLGKEDEKYISQILEDYFYLNYICKEQN